MNAQQGTLVAGLVTTWAIGSASAAYMKPAEVTMTPGEQTESIYNAHYLYTSNSSYAYNADSSSYQEEYARDIVPAQLSSPMPLQFEVRDNFVGAVALVGLDANDNILWASPMFTWSLIAVDASADNLGTIAAHLKSGDTASLLTDFRLIGTDEPFTTTTSGEGIGAATFTFGEQDTVIDVTSNLNRVIPDGLGAVTSEAAGTVNIHAIVPEPASLMVLGCSAGIFLLRRGRAQRVA